MKLEIKKLISDIVYILMGLQIVLGSIWLFCNLQEVPRFEESTELISLSKSLGVDEYAGILYPLCIRGALELGRLTGLSGCSLLYLLQLGAAYWAVVCLLKQVVPDSKKRVWFFAGFVVTIPTVLQCVAAVLPYTFATAFFLLLLAEGITLWKGVGTELTQGRLFRMAVYWILAAWSCPAYVWFGAGAVGVIAVRAALRLKTCKVFRVRLGILCVAVALCFNAVKLLPAAQEDTPKIQNTIGAAMLRRVVWPNFAGFCDFWQGEVLDTFDGTQLLEISNYPEQVIYVFGPVLEEKYGKEKANEIYWDMSKAAFSLNTKQVLTNMLKDAAAYVCPQLTMLLQLQGIGVSYTGWNYGRMKDYTPVLTRYYVNCALNAWLVLMPLVLVYWSIGRPKKKASKAAWAKRREARQSQKAGGYLFIMSLLINLWYVMSSGGMQDYKKLTVNSILCAVWLVYLMCAGSGIENGEEKPDGQER